MKALDFFCGAGGLTRGLLDAGINVVAGIDADFNCRDTYVRNNPQVTFLHRDISSIDKSTLRDLLGAFDHDDLLIAGCAPCQPFSKQRKPNQANERNKMRRESDAKLLGELSRIIEIVKPAHVLVENVPGLRKVPGFSTYRRFIRMLRMNKYVIDEDVLDAKHFGAPQTRRRFVLVASRTRLVTLPEPTHGPGLLPYRTVMDGISHFPPLAAGSRSSIIPNHVAASLSDLNLQRIAGTPTDGGDRRSWTKSLVLDCHKDEYDGHSDVYGRMFWNRPAPTLTSKCNSLSNGRYGHPEQNRAISLREAASLQTFPDSYLFHGLDQQIARQIGNAVPVVFARALGRALLAAPPKMKHLHRLRERYQIHQKF
jgi:DNA (cytosine-5)-methyltransferase 1